MNRARLATLPTLAALTAGLLALGPATPARSVTAACEFPAQVLNLTNWKIQLPIGKSEHPTEVKQPKLATYAKSPWFTVTSSCDGVQFRASVNGVTTSGSNHPRSELREMKNNGADAASWSSSSGTHTMIISQSINNLPADKPQVIAGQIHDANEDISVFRLEGTNLYVTEGNNSHHKLVTSSYVPGTRFEATFVVSGGQIKAYYNGVLQTTISKRFSGAYFKAGAYPQDNCDSSSPCDSGNFGQVTIYKLTVTHT